MNINGENSETSEVEENQHETSSVVKLPTYKSDPDQIEPITLDHLPEELLIAILCLLNLKDARSLSKTCEAFQAAFKAVPNLLHRHWLLQSLWLTPETTTCIFFPDTNNHDWRQARENVERLFEKLSLCKPPGCKYQKYLRWLQGEKADCPIIRKALVGVSMLPLYFLDMFQDSDQADKENLMERKEKLTERSWKMLGWMFPYCEVGSDSPQSEVDIPCKRSTNVGKYFDYQKFLKLMDFILLDPEESDKRLRQVMAEYHQISCRGLFEDQGFQNCLFNTKHLKYYSECRVTFQTQHYPSRQMQALMALVQFGNPVGEEEGDDNEINYWAN